MKRLPALAAALGLVLAGGAGAFAATAFTNQQEPIQTVTINVATGPAGPQGERGPQGPPGTPDCGEGFSWSLVKFNTPGGQKTLKACAENE